MGGPGSGRPRKVHPADMVESVRRLYFDEGMSQDEVGAELGVSQRVIYKLMRNHGLQTRPQVKRDQLGEKNANWKGDGIAYAGCHRRVEAAFGKPLECQRCGRTGPGCRYQWANLTGNYADVNDYERMCIPCHRRFDAERRTMIGKRTSEWRKKAESTAREMFRSPV
jgi:hypothetical protein